MAAVREIRLYPVKALDPISVPEARVLASGALEWDRRFALFDARGRFVNGKNFAGIHPIRATYDLARGEIALDSQAFSLTRQGGNIAAWFSGRLNEPVEWREDAAAGFPDDTEAAGPTLVSEASIHTVADWFALDAEQVRRRFRVNIEISGLPAFGEDRWYGSAVRIGGGVTVNAVNPCARCVVPSRDSLTGAQDAGFQRRFAELRKQHLPAWAKTAAFDHYYRFSVNTRIAAAAGQIIRVGDDVVDDE